MGKADSDEVGAGRVEQLLRKFLGIQSKRASAYNSLQQGFSEYLKTGAELPYLDLCGQVTREFSGCSQQILEVEAALRDPSVNRLDLALVLQDVQLQEKEKLRMTATLQVLRTAGQPSERKSVTVEHGRHGSSCTHATEGPSCDENTGLEMALLEAEYEAAVKEATGVIQNAILAINERIEEVRYEVEELEQKRETSLSSS